MTVALAWLEGGRVYVGADRRVSWDGGFAKSHRSKLLRNGPYVFAFAGHSQAVSHLAHIQLPEPPARPSHMDRWLATDFVPACRKALGSEGIEVDGDILLCMAGHRPVLIENWQTTIMVPAVVGSGGDACLGAWHALAGTKPRERLKKALTAACLVSPECGDGLDLLVL